ncbi:MAG: ACT domain-containing protein [Thermoanaerobaculia bacterium]
MKISFSVVPGDYAVARLGPAEPVLGGIESGRFFAVTRTEEELSIVCAQQAVPKGARAERGWALLKLRGPFAFDQVGVLASVLAPLAEAGVSIFAVSTFDTDYLLVKQDRLAAAVAALSSAGHRRIDR